MPAFGLSAGVGVLNAFVFEIVMTFGLVYTVYATAIDPKNGSLGTIAPIAIGFIVGANNINKLSIPFNLDTMDSKFDTITPGTVE